jgi:hypothetical protein
VVWHTVFRWACLFGVMVLAPMAWRYLRWGIVGAMTLRHGEAVAGVVTQRYHTPSDGPCVSVEYPEPKGVVRRCGRVSKGFYASVTTGDRIRVRYLRRWWTKWALAMGPRCLVFDGDRETARHYPRMVCFGVGAGLLCALCALVLMIPPGR